MTKRRPIELLPPPREVPLPLASRLLFGGFLNQFAWAWLSFGLVPSLPFIAMSELPDLPRFRGTLAYATGTVTRVETTSASVNDEHVMAARYRFQVDGKDYDGTSYATGYAPKEGSVVDIEYPSGDPSISRIQGMRTRSFSSVIAFVLIFPFIGLILICFGVRKGRRGLRMLRVGIVGYGRLVSKRETNMHVNNRPVFELVFEFTTDYGETHDARVRSHTPEKLLDEAEEPLLYDPDVPGDNALLDDLPAQPRITEDGELLPSHPFAGLLVLLLPALSGLVLLIGLLIVT